MAERVLVGAVDAAYRHYWRQVVGAAAWGVDTLFGRIEAIGFFSVDKPAFALSAASNAARLGISANARFEVILGGAHAGGVFVHASTEVLVPIRVNQQDRFRKAIVDLTGITLQVANLRLTWLGGPFDGRSDAALLRRECAKGANGIARPQGERLLVFQLPTDQVWMVEMNLMTRGMPGSVIFTPLIKLGGARVLDGWLAGHRRLE